MRKKLHRGRHKVFRKRRSALKTVGTVVLAVGVVAVGFFGAKFFTEHPLTPTSGEDTGKTTTSATTPTSTGSTKPTGVTPVVTDPDTLRAFYVTAAQFADGSVDAVLPDAAAAGFNAVVVDLKDSAGVLYFRSATARAQKVNSFAEGALTPEALEERVKALRQAGFGVIPRLYAFRDNAAARALKDARISYQGQPSWVWYDGDPKKDGKAWLNPYADSAQQYIFDLAVELRDAGAAAILLDGVQFPQQVSGASFGDSANTAMSHAEILTAFIANARVLLGDGCPVILSSPCMAALGSNTTAFGGNPLTFTPTVAAPSLCLSTLGSKITVGGEKLSTDADHARQTVQALVNQMILRTKVMEDGDRPTLMPWLQAYDLPASAVADEITGCRDGGAEAFILYDPAGEYPFDALKG